MLQKIERKNLSEKIEIKRIDPFALDDKGRKILLDVFQYLESNNKTINDSIKKYFNAERDKVYKFKDIYFRLPSELAIERTTIYPSEHKPKTNNLTEKQKSRFFKKHANRADKEYVYQVFSYKKEVGEGQSFVYKLKGKLKIIENKLVVTNYKEIRKNKVIKEIYVDSDSDPESTNTKEAIKEENKVSKVPLNQKKVTFIKDENKKIQRAFLVMDNLGISLDNYLRDYTPSIQRKLEISIDFLEELKKLHRNGIIHRDIKMENILIDPNTRKITICDFGFHTRITNHKRKKEIGTYTTMAPEVAVSENYDERCDIYSASCVLSRIFGETGRQICSSWDLQIKQIKQDYKKNQQYIVKISQSIETQWSSHLSGKKGLNKLADVIQKTRTSRPKNRQTLDFALDGLRQIQKNDIKKEGTFWSRHKGKVIFGLTAVTLTLVVTLLVFYCPPVAVFLGGTWLVPKLAGIGIASSLHLGALGIISSAGLIVSTITGAGIAIISKIAAAVSNLIDDNQEITPTCYELPFPSQNYSLNSKKYHNSRRNSFKKSINEVKITLTQDANNSVTEGINKTI